jgi:hypothetical protein
MTAVARGALIALWVLAVGLTAVYLEVEETRRGVRIRDLLIERDVRLEKIRRLELKYNTMVSPDLLEKRLPDEFQSGDKAARQAKGIDAGKRVTKA